MSKLVWGAGFNDKTRPVSVDGKKVKECSLWQDMLTRCFSEKYQDRKSTRLNSSHSAKSRMPSSA